MLSRHVRPGLCIPAGGPTLEHMFEDDCPYPSSSGTSATATSGALVGMQEPRAQSARFRSNQVTMLTANRLGSNERFRYAADNPWPAVASVGQIREVAGAIESSSEDKNASSFV